MRRSTRITRSRSAAFALTTIRHRPCAHAAVKFRPQAPVRQLPLAWHRSPHFARPVAVVMVAVAAVTAAPSSRSRPDPRHGDRAPDRHRAQSAGAAAAVPARHRVLPEDDPALGGRAARPADCARRDRGARIGDRDPGDRLDGRHAGRRVPARARLRLGARPTGRWRAPAPRCAEPPPRSQPRSCCPTTRARRPTSPSSSSRSMRCRPWRWCSIRSICPSLGFDAQTTGVMLGATIHDVAQVVGAGYAVSEPAGNTAVIVKLFRVLPDVARGPRRSAGCSRGAPSRPPPPRFRSRSSRSSSSALCVLNSIAAAVPAIAPAFAQIKAPLIEASTWGLLDRHCGARARHLADRHRRARLAPCRDHDRHDARHPGGRDRGPDDAALNRRAGERCVQVSWSGCWWLTKRLARSGRNELVGALAAVIWLDHRKPRQRAVDAVLEDGTHRLRIIEAARGDTDVSGSR